MRTARHLTALGPEQGFGHRRDLPRRAKSVDRPMIGAGPRAMLAAAFRRLGLCTKELWLFT